MDKPTNLKQLVAYLEENQDVRITGPTPTSREPTMRDEQYLFCEQGHMWFQPVGSVERHHIPINCRLTDAAAANEAGVTFDEAGFTVTKFGVPIRVEYLS